MRVAATPTMLTTRRAGAPAKRPPALGADAGSVLAPPKRG
jgi:hypothetical protein